MKKIAILLAIVALLLCSAACSQRADEPSMSSSESVSNISQPKAISSSASTPEAYPPPESSEPDVSSTQPALDIIPPEGSVAASLVITGEGQKDIQLNMHIPEQWQADGNKLIEDGREVAQFTAVTPIENVAAFLEELDANHPDAEHSSEVEPPGLTGKYYLFQTEESDGSKKNELLYYICIDDNVATITFYPAFGVGIGTQREEFELYLATLNIQQ